MLFRLLLCGGLLWASTAFPASRVGNGTVSNDVVGFQTDAPAPYYRPQTYSDGNVRFEGPMSLLSNGGVPSPQLIFLFILENVDPDLKGQTDRQMFRNHFESLGWQRFDHADPCVEAFTKPGQNAINYILSWGDGRGIVGVTFDHPMQRVDVSRMVNNLRVMEGSCAWK